MQIPSFYEKFDKVYKNLSEIKKENDNSQIIRFGDFTNLQNWQY